MARGEARLVGMMTSPAGRTCRPPDEMRVELPGRGGAPGICFDAIPTRATVRSFGFPTGPPAGDVAALHRLPERAGRTMLDFARNAHLASAAVRHAFATYFES